VRRWMHHHTEKIFTFRGEVSWEEVLVSRYATLKFVTFNK